MPHWPTIKLKADFNLLRQGLDSKNNCFYYSTDTIIIRGFYFLQGLLKPFNALFNRLNSILNTNMFCLIGNYGSFINNLKNLELLKKKANQYIFEADFFYITVGKRLYKLLNLTDFFNFYRGQIGSKLAFILTKKFGKANVRNLARRRLRFLVFNSPLLSNLGFLYSIYVKPLKNSPLKAVYSFNSLSLDFNKILNRVLLWQKKYVIGKILTT